MKIFNKTFLALAGLGLSLGLVSSLSTPVDTAGFSFIGGSLGTGQRDFRVFNNFTDSQANNNTTPDANFPGTLGATQAIWKGHIEWGSEWWKLVGDQDPTQSKLGTGFANFDNNYQGEAGSAGGGNSNIHSELFDPSPGGTLAFTQTPISDGWTIKYLSGWTWHDGPGTVSGGVDLQGVACHEIGHSLGLGHSGVSGATMLPSISGTGVGARSINTDDAAGVRALYGNKSASKLQISAISGSTSIGGTLTITGQNFSNSNNVIWFTDANADGTARTVSGVSSSSGGTVINVTIPNNVADGSVMVKGNFSGGVSLSNEWPIDIGGAIGDPPIISSISPSSGPEGGLNGATISGAGFLGTTSVKFDAVDVASFTVDSALQITISTPGGVAGNVVDVVVTDPDGTDTLSNAYTYTADPVPGILLLTPNAGPAAGGTTVSLFGTMGGVSQITFGGVPGTNLMITSPASALVDTPPGLGVVDVVATNGSGSGTKVNGFTYTSSGGFVDLGPSGIAGTFGEPVFSGAGDLTPGSMAGFTLTCIGAQPFSLGFLFLGFAPNTPVAPFFGGTFYPFPFLSYVIVPFNGVGALVAAGTVDAGTPPGTSVVMQFFFNDGAAVQGISGSNGLRMDVP